MAHATSSSTYTQPNLNLASMAKALCGEIRGDTIMAPGPGHSPSDRSLSVTLSLFAPDGFLVHSFADDDPIKCKDYVRQRCDLGSFTRRPASVNAEYIYRDAAGANHIKILRRFKNGRKDFPQFRWEGSAWIAGTRGLRRLPLQTAGADSEPGKADLFR